MADVRQPAGVRGLGLVLVLVVAGTIAIGCNQILNGVHGPALRIQFKSFAPLSDTLRGDQVTVRHVTYPAPDQMTEEEQNQFARRWGFRSGKTTEIIVDGITVIPGSGDYSGVQGMRKVPWYSVLTLLIINDTGCVLDVDTGELRFRKATDLTPTHVAMMERGLPQNVNIDRALAMREGGSTVAWKGQILSISADPPGNEAVLEIRFPGAEKRDGLLTLALRNMESGERYVYGLLFEYL